MLIVSGLQGMMSAVYTQTAQKDDVVSTLPKLSLARALGPTGWAL